MRQAAIAVLVLGVFIVLSQAAMAANYQIDVTPLNNSIIPTQSASFKVLVSNFEKQQQRFQVYTLDPDWSLRFEPMLYTVPPTQLTEYIMYVRPRDNIGYGTHGVSVFFKNLADGIILKQSLIVLVNDPNQLPGVYTPSVKLDVSLPQDVDPRQSFKVGISLRNRNPLNMSTVTVRVSSSLFNSSYDTSLASLGETQKDLTFRLDPHQAPGQYPVRVTLVYRNSTINEFSTPLVVAPITAVDEQEQDSSGYFRTESRLLLENTGNVETTYDAKLPTSWIRTIFTSTAPKTASERIGGQRYYVWHVHLAPGETAQVAMTENYRLLIVLIVLAIIAVIGYYLFRSPLIAVKETIALKEGEGSSNLKVRIFVKNRTGKTLDAVIVTDRIPSIASYVKREVLGMVSPTKVVHAEKKGTILKWDLDILEPYEERILSYSLTSKLKIVGKIRLPSAKIHFATSGGKERVTYTKDASYEE